MNLTDLDRKIFEWQLDVPGFGVEGQEKLKSASVLVSRVGGLGSVVAYELAAAGVGKLILAHEGRIKHSDLNRQILMSYNDLGTLRVDSARKKLLALNPQLEIETIPENINESNAGKIIARADVIVDAAPLFEERFQMNKYAVKQQKPMIDCAMYDMEAQITTIIPGKTACLSCLYPERPEQWKRRFPVFGAVSGTVGCLGAMEAIKVISGLGNLLTDILLVMDYRDMSFEKIKIRRNEKCRVCQDIYL